MSGSTPTPDSITAPRTSRRRTSRTRPSALILRLVLTAVAVLGLAYDAYVHFDLAAGYDAIGTSTLSQGDLFRVEAVAAVLAASAVAVRPRRYTVLFALVVAAAGFAAVIAYRYVDIKGFGPSPRCTSRSGTPRRPVRPTRRGQRPSHQRYFSACSHFARHDVAPSRQAE